MNRLKYLREEKGLSLKDLKDEILKEFNVKISRASLSNYERGEQTPKRDTWEILAKYFEVSPSYVMGLSDIKNEDTTIVDLKEIFNSDENILINNVNEKDIKTRDNSKDLEFEDLTDHEGNSLLALNKGLFNTPLAQIEIIHHRTTKIKNSNNFVFNSYLKLIDPISKDLRFTVLSVYFDFESTKFEMGDKECTFKIPASVSIPKEMEIINFITDYEMRFKKIDGLTSDNISCSVLENFFSFQMMLDNHNENTKKMDSALQCIFKPMRLIFNDIFKTLDFKNHDNNITISANILGKGFYTINI